MGRPADPHAPVPQPSFPPGLSQGADRGDEAGDAPPLHARALHRAPAPERPDGRCNPRAGVRRNGAHGRAIEGGMNITPERRAERESESAAIAGICFVLLIALVAVPLWMACLDWINGGAK